MEEMQQAAEAAPEAIVEAPVEQVQAETPVATKAPSRMEALEKAFKSTEAEPAKEAAEKPVEAKETATEGPQRGPDGKFVAKAPEAPAEVKSPLSDPPARFSPDAKAAWAAAPEAIKGEVKRAFSEMERGLVEKDQIIAPIKPYLQMAKEQGVNFHEVVGKYVQMEQLLMKDPMRGFEALANNMGLTLQQLGERITGQASQPNAKDHQIMALNREIAALKEQFGQVHQTVQQQRESSVIQTVQQFAADKPRFDELAPEMTKLLQTGYAEDLQQAYEMAERLNPAPQPVAPTVAAPQPRPLRSVTGAPTTGSNPAYRQPSSSRTEALARAFAQTGLT